MCATIFVRIKCITSFYNMEHCVARNKFSTHIAVAD